MDVGQFLPAMERAGDYAIPLRRRVIQERNGAGTPQVAYTRGVDLSGRFEGAGGIGGLLARSQGYSGGNWSTHHFYHADGNGNITAMMDTSQALAATYRYDAYGKLLSSSGGMAAANVYRFSSKEFHSPSGLYYYGYRFYDPANQRWLNRDPIGEMGELNLYGLCRNNGVNAFDLLGLYGRDVHDQLTYHAAMEVQSVKNTCWPKMYGVLLAENLGQDLVRLGAYERHYNRKVGSPGAQGNTDYANYLDQEQRTFNSNLQNPNKSKCKLALKVLGRMSHSWQDFFAYAIQIDDKSWVAWSAGVTGTPDDTGSFFPSSYSFNPLGGSEHPPYSEPIQPGNVEYRARYDAAQSYTTAKFGQMLPVWPSKCECSFCGN